MHAREVLGQSSLKRLCVVVCTPETEFRARLYPIARYVIGDALRQLTPPASFAHVDEKSQGTLKHLRHFSVMPSQVLLRNSGLVSDSARLI